MTADPNASQRDNAEEAHDLTAYEDEHSDEGGQSRSFFGRMFDAFTGTEEEEDGDGNGKNADPDAPGMGNLRRLRVDDVAVPKPDIIAAPSDIKLDDLVEMFREHGFSRIPVFKGNLDSPQGFIHLKDLTLKHGFGAKGRFNLKPMLREVLYVPPSMPIGVLLQQMQQKRTHMALVIDEYGGVDGLVTIEDLIEQVIGEIEDEHDEAEANLWKEEKPGQYVIQAKASLSDVEEATGLSLADDNEDEDVDTMGGLIFMLTGRVPLRGEVIEHDSGAVFEVIEADPRRIKRIRLRMPADG